MSLSLPSEALAPSELSLDLLPQVERRMLAAVGLAHAAKIATRPALLRACAHHLGAGGQRVRALLALDAGVTLGIPDVDAVTIAATVELLHNASLIHDDLQDRSAQRRGAPTVQSAFGAGIALCAGDLLLSGAYGVLAGYSATASLPRLLALTHSATADAAQGQSADVTPPPGLATPFHGTWPSRRAKAARCCACRSNWCLPPPDGRRLCRSPAAPPKLSQSATRSLTISKTHLRTPRRDR